MQTHILNLKEKMIIIKALCFQVQSQLEIVLLMMIKNNILINKIENIKRIFTYITNKILFK